MIKHKVSVFYILSSLSLCLAQKNDSTFYYINKTTPITHIENRIKNSIDSIDKKWFKLLFSIKKRNDSALLFFKDLSQEKNLKTEYQAKLFFLKGIYFKRTDNDSLSYANYLSAYKKAEDLKDTLTLLKSLEQLSQTYDYEKNNYYNKFYLDLFLKNASIYNIDSYKIRHLFLLGNYYLFRKNNLSALSCYKKALTYTFKPEDSILIPSIYNNLGTLYSENLNKPDSALYYFNKQSLFIKNHTNYANSDALFLNYINIGSAYNNLKNYTEANKYYLKADSLKIIGNKRPHKSFIKENLAQLNYKMNNYKLAYKYLNQYNQLSDSLNTKDHNISIARIKEQYDNEKLRANNLESESKRKQNRNLLIGALVFILFGGTTAFLIQKNTRKKQKLAEQEKALETQKLATVLKEQELTSIDAMIEGQEKERQRIANDLHDDLGGLMATVKLHFNVLKDKPSPELFGKTNALLDEAYNKVRTVAHAKNSGVIAKQGLLKAVQNMADKISGSNTITIDVIDHGLDERLENSLELTIFRIIQELITNVIKHATATQASIHLTNHEDTLNIMIEDNGKGFNARQITTKNKGMGLSTIDKRVEHLNGTMTIESEPNKGTTIIIDIPI